MRRLLLAALGVSLLAGVGCRIEDHTPTGSRQDEIALESLLRRYSRDLADRNWADVRALFWGEGSYSGPLVPRSVGRAVSIDSALRTIAFTVDGARSQSYDVRVLRTDLRQDGDLASAWITVRRRMPLANGSGWAERDWLEHLVFRRIGGRWRIISVAGSAAPRGILRSPR
jgi:SnoaL-like domain